MGIYSGAEGGMVSVSVSYPLRYISAAFLEGFVGSINVMLCV